MLHGYEETDGMLEHLSVPSFPSPESLITVTPNLRERWDSRKTGSDKRERKDILDRIMDSIEVSSSFVWACSLAAILY